MVNTKVLLNDGLDEEGLELFHKVGIETNTEKKDQQTLVEVIGNYDGLVVRSATDVPQEVIEAGAIGNLKIVGRAGVGVDNIDAGTSTENGVIVKFAPYGNTNSAAQHTLFLIGAVSRNIPQSHYALKNGIWQKKPFKGVELTPETTLGVIGCGRVGQRLSELVRGLDVNVVGYDESPEKVKNYFPNSRIKYMSKEEVIEISDYVSVHIGGKVAIIGESELSHMKRTAYIINTSRGGNIDEEALYKVLKNGTIAGAGLDVYSNESEFKEGGEFNNRLKELDNVVLTPHLGASTNEAQRKTSIEIAEVVIGYLLRGDFTNAVNVGESVAAEERPVFPMFIHHLDQSGIFADISDILRKHNINIRENPSRQLGKDGTATTVYLLHQHVGPEALKQINALPRVYRALI
ncbi:MAG: phosphoglycerate dehydrogenase [Candidatus Woesearchaeota archaeon]|nr:phosphoglycerate dehydrogenase [Candidatus Woesearchaeota archaeon]